jgi:hypothetical protein
MDGVRSADGTAISYTRAGSGPAVVLTTGSLDDGAENAPLAAQLAKHFTVFNYARRGRGASGDTQPYAVERELEDLAALIDAAGGSAFLYGVSTGGALALEAAAAGLAIDGLAVYEVPYAVGEDAARQWREYVRQLRGLLAHGRRDAALELFMRFAGARAEDVVAARSSSVWPGLEALAHTLAYDAAILGDGPPPSDRLATITQPALVATGGPEPDPYAPDAPVGFFERAADAVAAALPRAERLTLAGQPHVVDPVVLAPELERFFTAASTS